MQTVTNIYLYTLIFYFPYQSNLFYFLLFSYFLLLFVLRDIISMHHYIFMYIIICILLYFYPLFLMRFVQLFWTVDGISKRQAYRDSLRQITRAIKIRAERRGSWRVYCRWKRSRHGKERADRLSRMHLHVSRFRRPCGDPAAGRSMNGTAAQRWRHGRRRSMTSLLTAAEGGRQRGWRRIKGKTGGGVGAAVRSVGSAVEGWWVSAVTAFSLCVDDPH